MTEIKNNPTATVVSSEVFQAARKELFSSEAKYGEECPIFMYEENPEVVSSEEQVLENFFLLKEGKDLKKRKGGKSYKKRFRKGYTFSEQQKLMSKSPKFGCK